MSLSFQTWNNKIICVNNLNNQVFVWLMLVAENNCELLFHKLINWVPGAAFGCLFYLQTSWLLQLNADRLKSISVFEWLANSLLLSALTSVSPHKLKDFIWKRCIDVLFQTLVKWKQETIWFVVIFCFVLFFSRKLWRFYNKETSWFLIQ